MQRKGKGSSGSEGKVVVIAVKASREIPRAALLWALTHVVQPGDCIKLVAVIPPQSSGKKIWGLARFTSDCTTGHHHYRSIQEICLDMKDDIVSSCSEVMFQLHQVYDPEKVKFKLKIIYGSSLGVVAAESKRVNSSWVILDKGLKQEAKSCIDELRCNIVVMKRSKAKVLRLNLTGSANLEQEVMACSSIEVDIFSTNPNTVEYETMIKGPMVTPASSPEHDGHEQESPLTSTDVGSSSISSSDLGNSPYFASAVHRRLKKENYFGDEIIILKPEHCGSESDVESESLDLCSAAPNLRSWIKNVVGSSDACEISKGLRKNSDQKPNDKKSSVECSELLDELSKFDRGPSHLSRQSLRQVIPSISSNNPLKPPPLCSVCQHKAPIFGNPPRWFSYSDLELATDGFSQENFLAEGGYGSVHRGVLVDSQVIAVKQHKLASSQGDREFCSEVEVLSCAQHRNLVTLIGFCVEDGRRLLVYEYVCNGSLDYHLYGRHNHGPLDWPARQKIAVGAARGLRYLHEECRVGCIVHRDLRPNNILLTHDFEPLVGDFGLARWQPEGDMGVETRVIGTFGYLSPEYAQTGQITEKADVYSFGVVLVELVTGRKAMDINRPKGQQCLTEWARPLLERQAIRELIDPKLNDCYDEKEICVMLHCASLCIRRDPLLRPRMSHVRYMNCTHTLHP
ncbi:hypothetical protein SAY87_002557 [Trapa incisa]|uniref:Protein kinase domain-containing protein n=1 Tax=Trapa incisa TaxID=236973 RepID=A0AAN7JU96_9MYRT|nr:hypothetical protein SAY87_002557 [Trapa incisa]